MATELLSLTDVDLDTTRRSLLIVWQNPRDRRFVKIGRLDVLADGRYAFHYLPESSNDPEFSALDEYPNRDAVYVSESLPAFFANRVMSTERPSYEQYLHWLGVEGIGAAELPVEILARTGGSRATDTFHVLDLPELRDGGFSSRFFVSGIRHLGNEAGLAELREGAELQLRLEPENPKNPRAVIIDAAENRQIGWVPDWLCGEVHALMQAGWQVTATAERVNHDAPAHVRVLCRLDARKP